MSELDTILTVGDLATYLHVHRSTIYRLLKRREIPGFRLGSDWRFSQAAVDKWMRDRIQAGVDLAALEKRSA